MNEEDLNAFQERFQTSRSSNYCYYAYTILKISLLVAILVETPYKETRDLYILIGIATGIEVYESVFLVIEEISARLRPDRRLKKLVSLRVFSCEAMRFILAIGLIVELTGYKSWVNSGIGYMSIYIICISSVKFITILILFVYFYFYFRAYFNDLRAHRTPSLDRDILNSFIADTLPEDTECSICLEAYDQQKKWVILPCKHSFHQDCLGDWIIIKGICPVCRKSINST